MNRTYPTFPFVSARRWVRLCSAVLLGLLSMATPEARGQVTLPDRSRTTQLEESVFGLGLAAGPASGIGLSFRHHLPAPFSYQLTGGIIKVDERLLFSVGLEGQFDLGRSEASRFFMAMGTGYYYSGRRDGNELDAPGRIGFGVGGEFIMSADFHATVELLFTYFTDGTVLPLPQVGVSYYFY